ncbi:hypothetical protein [Desulfospira joergensenii]|nr:hypothetical protein [Desulfospira joergensenii]
MKTTIKEFNNEKYEVLDHAETPGFKTAFHIVLSVAVIYFIYIFAHLL